MLKQEIADRFFAAVVKRAHLRRYISGEHFSVDGTLLEAWASHKSFRPKDDDGKGGPPCQGPSTFPTGGHENSPPAARGLKVRVQSSSGMDDGVVQVL